VHPGTKSADRGEWRWLARGRDWIRVDPRPVPAIRLLRTTLRTLHLIAFGALYGGHLYGVPPDRLEAALVATVASGGAFMALEIFRAPIWLFQVRGVATLAKIGLLATVAAVWELRIPLLTLVLIIGAVSSHMPGRWRYHSVLHGRVVGPRETG
jgi:hypothetical protein